MLVKAADPASLFAAIGEGLGPLFPHLSLNASFNFDRKGHPHTVWSNVPQPPRSPEWVAGFSAGNPGLPYAAAHPGIPVFCMDEVIPPDAYDAHPFIQKYVKPEGWAHVLGFFVWNQREIVGYIAINRSAAHGAFTAEERAFARELHPLIAAAHARIAAARRENDLRQAQEELLRTLPLAIVAWTPRDGRILFHNRAAIEAIARWRGEGTRKRPRAVTADWLPDDLVAASNALAREGAEVIRGGQRAMLRRATAPAPTQSHFAKDVVLVVVHDEGAPATPSPAWLRVASGFTTAEREVARLAARGLSNADIAQALGKSPLTVKKQLESVFTKAAVEGRTELAALFAGLDPMRDPSTE